MRRSIDPREKDLSRELTALNRLPSITTIAWLGFEGVVPEETGRPAYHPATMLKIYVYGYVNQVQSSRRLERETARNVEMMWLTGRLTPDFKTIADFRKDNGPAICSACRQFVALCRSLNLFVHAMVVIDGSRFKAVNSRGRSFSRGSIERRMEQVEASIERYLSALETADRQEGEVAEAKSARLKDKIASARESGCANTRRWKSPCRPRRTNRFR